MLCATILTPAALASDYAWLAFRYSAEEVLLYVAKATDNRAAPAGATDLQLPQPIAKWGGGGYLLLFPAKHFSQVHFESTADRAVLDALHPGSRLTVRLDSRLRATAVVERFVEQWGISNPEVLLGVIARVTSPDRAGFRSARSGYFIAYRRNPTGAIGAPASLQIIGERTVLNDLGRIGQIVLLRGEAGWSVALWRYFDGSLKPTDIAYSYGD